MILKTLLILSSAPLQIFIIHIVASRCLRKISPQLMAIGCILVGQVPMGLVLWFFVFSYYPMTLSVIIATGFYAFIIYNALASAYFHLFNMSETARRIKVLYEIDKAGFLSKEAISLKYGTPEILFVRLKRLVDLRQLGYDGCRYILTGRLLYLAAWIVMLWGRILGFQNK